MIQNPIFRRELNGAVRDTKVVALIAAVLVSLSAILLFLWPATGIFSLASDSSMQIFQIFLMSNLALIILLVPALTSTSITTERENKSYDLLFTTLLTPAEIMKGKLFAALAMIVLVVMVSMPIAALCTLSGGVSAALLCRAYALITMAALTYGMLGLAVSALCRRTFTALIITYCSVAILAGSTWLPYQLFGRIYVLRYVWQFILCLSPFAGLHALMFPERFAREQISVMSQNYLLPYYMHMAGMAVLMLFFFVVFRKFVFHAPRPASVFRWIGRVLLVSLVPIVAIEVYACQFVFSQPEFSALYGSPVKIVLVSAAIDILLLLIIRGVFNMAKSDSVKYADQYTDRGKQIKRKLTWPFYLIDPLRRKRPIGRFKNPVYVAEMRSKIFGKPKFIIRGLATCIIISMVLLILVCIQLGTNLREDNVRWAAIFFQIGIIAILAPTISSGSITDEITSNTMLMLRMTPLSAIRVVLGKLRASFTYVSIFLISSLPVLFALAYLEAKSNYWRVGVWCAILLLTTVALVTAGLCASAFANTTSSATGMSYCFSGLICIVTFAAMLPDAFSTGTRRFILTLNPIVAALRMTSDHLFTELPEQLWIHNMVFLAAVSLFFIGVASARIYVLFTRRV